MDLTFDWRADRAGSSGCTTSNGLPSSHFCSSRRRNAGRGRGGGESFVGCDGKNKDQATLQAVGLG